MQSPKTCKRLVLRGHGSEKPGFFLKSPTHLVLGVSLSCGLRWVFRIFYLNQQLGSLLVDLAHQLSFYLDLQIHYLLVIRSCKHKEIFNYH